MFCKMCVAGCVPRATFENKSLLHCVLHYETALGTGSA